VHNLHSCSVPLRQTIDAHASRLEGWGVPRAAIERAVDAAVIVASLTEDSVLASALLAQSAYAADAQPTKPGELARELELHFGPEACGLARELEHFGDIRLSPAAAASHHLEPAQAEALRKMLLSVVSDPRLVLARLAWQLVDLLAAKDGHAATRQRLALETREVFAPLANRLGLWQLKWELEDLAFRYLQPDDYRRIAAALAEKRIDREQYIAVFCRKLEDMMRGAGIHDGEVYGRPKHIYSIFRKMERKQLSFEQVFDLRAVRIVVGSVAECYTALGLVHGAFTYIRGEFDDYIATPKDNFYRSIHTAVLGPEGKAVEVQIRTREMHDQAELGLAAHWRYKEGRLKELRANDVSYDRKIEWVRKLLEPQQEGAGGDRDFLDQVRTELFEDRVYALTPKGEVVDLPHAATPLDFAYHVHTDLGHRCRGARVNGRIVPLTRPLTNGEIVEIITHKHPQPSRDWLSETQGFLTSARARSKVRAWFRKLDDEAAQKAGVVAGPAPEPVIAPVTQVAPRRRVRSRKPSRSPVILGGVEDLPISLARCCGPVKPEPIAGYATVGRGVTVHRVDCPGLNRMSASRPDRLIAARWTDAESTQPVTLTIVAIDRHGLVRDIGDLLASEKMSIEMMHTTTDRTQSTATIDVRLGVGDAQHLTKLVQRIRKVGSVLSVRRSG
jgi:GTP pyrophosphokinase